MVKVLPYLDLNDTYLSHKQAIWIAVSSYVTAACFLGLFVFTIYNIVRYLIMQKRWRTYPLLMFYVLCFFCVGLRMCDSIWIMYLATKFSASMTLMAPILKLCIGLVQVLILVEICV
jgi:hypothetical protein